MLSEEASVSSPFSSMLRAVTVKPPPVSVTLSEPMMTSTGSPPVVVISPSPMLTLSVGASATPVTSTSSDVVAVVVSPVEASVVVTETPSVKSALLSAGGVMIRPSRSSASSVQVPSWLLVPALNSAPFGTSLMVIDMVSEPSASTWVTSISRAMALSSRPAASVVSISASEAEVSVASTEIVAVVVELSPSSSVAVAATVRSKAGVPSGTVISRPSRSPESSVQVPSPLSVPAESVTPSGTLLMVTETVSEPSVSESVAERSRS